MATAGDFDDERLLAALRGYLRAVDALNTADEDEPRRLLDLAEAKTLAALTLRRRLEQLGWIAPQHRASIH
jgi:hypothetical protein